MTYQIKENPNYNSREVYFDGKPSEMVRTALKGLKMRWNPSKSCWYGFATESAIIAALQDAELTDGNGATVITDGYMGGGAVYGSKSGLPLYGSNLAKAMKEDLKKAGIKGVTIRQNKSGYTDKFIITVTIETTDLKENFETDDINIMREFSQWGSVFDGNKRVHISEFDNGHIDFSGEKYLELKRNRSRYLLNRYKEEQQIHHFSNRNDYPEFTEEFADKMQKIQDIIKAYNYDESNSMVDYFNTNFYYSIHTKPGKTWN